MAATTKNSKELIVVNFKELPETICLETRFITEAVAKQKKHEQVYYMSTKNGQLELTRNEKTLQNFRFNMGGNKPSAVCVSIKPKISETVRVTTTTGPVSLAKIQQSNPLVPLATAISNYNNTHFNAMTNNQIPLQQPLLTAPTVSIPLSRPPQGQLNNYNISNNTMFTKVHTTERQDTGSMTEPRPQLRDHEQQTDNITPVMVSTAVQCEIDEDVEQTLQWTDNIEQEPTSDPLNVDGDKEEFLQFVTDNSIQYKNNLRECLICGEICKTHKYFYGHMAIHRGPKVLCYVCGQYLDHESLLNKHSCPKSKRIEKSFLRCPHHSCSVLAVSRLELYDHINEHINNRMHKCSVCKKDFCTTQEFLRHILLRAACYTGDKRKRFRLYGLESQKDRLCRVRVFTIHTRNKRRNTLVKTFLSQRTLKQSVCKLCFKTYRNKFLYNRHSKKCMALFRKRLAARKDKI